ncbi:M28 family peptidase [Oleiharenicola lentus]|uniref:M28 family peptidase n=1 Tax=Oleiharenicola lentus TaxID=2508720 RepID=UPI003F667238
MAKRILNLLFALALSHGALVAQSFDESSRAAHAMLTRLCDDFGGRVTGSEQNRRALEQLATELRALGVEPEIISFKMPGWERRVDKAELVMPFARPLRGVTIAYTQPLASTEADVVDIKGGQPEDYPADMRGKIALLSPSTTLQTRDFVRIAAEKGAKAILFINREGGGQLLARTGSFIGEALPLPVFSIAQEEGNWMKRLLERGKPVRVRLEATSRCREVDTANLRVVFKGKSPERIVVGAHVDSWDLGQGALDNGLGTAQLFALAHALRGQELARTVELHWYNGEEQGLWGSRHAAAQIGDSPIVAMINLDMVGVPIGVNALGDDSLVPALERWNKSLATPLPKGVENINWFGSDHTPYQLAGVRTITFNAPIPRESVRYYHDLADTIDKLPEKIVVDSTATIGSVLLALVNDRELSAMRRTPAETEKIFTTFGIDRRMRAIGYWPFN